MTSALTSGQVVGFDTKKFANDFKIFGLELGYRNLRKKKIYIKRQNFSIFHFFSLDSSISQARSHSRTIIPSAYFIPKPATIAS